MSVVKNNPRVLFILKKRKSNWSKINCPTYEISSGLYNSAKFVCEMLNASGIVSQLVEVDDNNSIDREVTLFKPTHVIIEALWVVPEKFATLIKLHPMVQWVVRLHSNVPFLSNEGIAIDWIIQYLEYDQLRIGFNSFDALLAFKKLLHSKKTYKDYKLVYLPNYYPYKKCVTSTDTFHSNEIHIGCFGAIRLMKNQLTQAMAAIEFARQSGVKLYYHINGYRVEGQSDSVLRNIRAIFNKLPIEQFELVEHSWLSHDEFLKVIDKLDMGLQVSYSETFNIVTADFISRGKPVVVSEQISWINRIFYADPNSIDDMVFRMKVAKLHSSFSNITKYLNVNYWGLRRYSIDSIKYWKKFLRIGK